MFSKHVKLLCFLVMLPSFLGSTDIIRPKVDVNVRGQSFGLENFLFQSYGEEIKPKPARSTGNQRLTNRGHTYNLEYLPAYDSSKIRPTEQKTNEPKPELNKFKDKINPTVGKIGAVQDTVTERIRKRIMMRRRRKKPQDGSNDINGNAIQKLVTIPELPEASKVVIRPKVPDQETVFRLKPQEVKLTMQTEHLEPKEKKSDTEKMTTTMKTSTINLKTFLKQQTETLSLSELLQTQNLSLADLIRGNKDASSILRAKQIITSTTPSVKRKYNRLEVEPNEEKFPKKIEVVEITTARPNYNRFQPKIPKVRPSESKSTEEIPDGGQTKRKSFTSGFDPQNRLNEMRLKLRNYQRKTTTPVVYTEAITVAGITEDTIEPLLKITEAPKKTKVYFKSTNNPELSVILPNKPKPDTKTQKRLEKPIWNNRLPPIKQLSQDRLKQSEISSKVLKAVEENFEETTTGPFEEPTPESKDELIELLKSGQNAERLQKILKSRNMTLQELLDNREKPPSQINITELFSSQEKTTATVKPTLFDSFPDFEGEIRSEYDEPEAEESAPSIARVKIIPNGEAEQYPISEKEETQLNLQPDDLTADKSNAETSALWKLSEKSIYYGSSYGYGDFAVQTEKSKRTTKQTESDIVLLETIQKNQETNEKFKLDFNDFVREEDEPQTEDIEKSYIPPAVKSAIIASGVVMGIALFVFVGIFAACGWKQRQIRLKSSLGDTSKKDKRTLSPLSFRDNSYKKSIDYDESSESGTSNTSSYLWSTLKNTFTSRTSTLKSRLEKEEKMREDKVTLRRNESRRKESRPDDRQITDERFLVKKLDGDRSVINTSFNFKKSMRINNVNHFNECVHGY